MNSGKGWGCGCWLIVEVVELYRFLLLIYSLVFNVGLGVFCVR